MGYELIPGGVTKYVMNSKEISKFILKGRKHRYSFDERVPREGEMIRCNMTDYETHVVTSGEENYIRKHYSDYAKEYYKYVVLAKKEDYHVIWKLIYVNF